MTENKAGHGEMGQLIKIQDYVSRYEQDIFLYPSRFVRLKTEQWEKLSNAWENNEELHFEDKIQTSSQGGSEWLEEDKSPFMHKIKGLLKLRKNELDHEPLSLEGEIKKGDSDEEAFGFTASFYVRPNSKTELKQQFLDQLFRFQMKWASSTLTEKSFVDKQFYYEEKLKYFLQRFPDTYLILYNPIFLLKNASIEAETILISPTGACCVSFLEAEDLSVFHGSADRFWVKQGVKEEKKVLNPLLALNRTEKIVQKVFQISEIEFPIYKAVLSRNGYIDYPNAPLDVQLIDKRIYDEWFKKMRNQRYPLKHTQLKSAQSLLHYSQTTSIRRLEWESNDD